MSILTKISQRESLDKLDKENKREILKAQVLAVLGTMQEPLTAREIAQRRGRTTRQDIQPRITELLQTGIIEEKGRKYDNTTDRNVTAYVLAGERI